MANIMGGIDKTPEQLARASVCAAIGLDVDEKIPPGARVDAADISARMADILDGDAIQVKRGVDGEVAMSEPRTRNLVFRFWNLASSQRRQITQRLGLLSDEEMRLPEPERYGRALLRASERGILDQIAAEIEHIEKGA